MENGRKMNDEYLVKVSLWSTIAFAVVGIGMGLWTRSQVIMFDGLYSFVSLLLSSLSLYAMGFMKKEDTMYPFGKGSIEPLVIIFKYIVLTGLILQSFISALLVFLDGGRTIPIGSGLVYSIGSTLGCYVVYKWLKENNKTLRSPLIEAEKNQWAVDTLISGGVMAGFLLTLFLEKVSILPTLIPYTDSLMVMLVTALFMRVPIREIRQASKQLLGKKTEEETFTRLEKQVNEIQEHYEMEDAVVRCHKLGSILRVEIDFIVSEDSTVGSIETQDKIRQELADVLDESDQPWMTVAFTGERKWAF